jgi:hypothetical protein
VPNLGVQASATATTIAPGATTEITAVVANAGGAGALASHLVISLPPTVSLVGPPYYERGSGCTGATTIDCFLDYVPNGGSTKVVFDVRGESAGAAQVALTVSADRDSDLSDDQATVALTVAAPSSPQPTKSVAVPPAARPPLAVAVAGKAEAGALLTARARNARGALRYAWQLRRGGRWVAAPRGTRRSLRVQAAWRGLRLRVRVSAAGRAAVSAPTAPVR